MNDCLMATIKTGHAAPPGTPERQAAEDAWAELYKRVVPLLVSVAAKRLPTDIFRQGEEQQEIAHRVMLRIWDEADAFTGSGFNAWACWRARNMAMDVARWHQRRGRMLDIGTFLSCLEGLHASDTPAERTVRAQLSHEDDYSAGDDISARRVRLVLGALQPRQRLVILHSMKHSDKPSPEQAGLFGLTRGAYKSLLHRSRREFIRIWRERYGGLPLRLERAS